MVRVRCVGILYRNARVKERKASVIASCALITSFCAFHVRLGLKTRSSCLPIVASVAARAFADDDLSATGLFLNMER